MLLAVLYLLQVLHVGGLHPGDGGAAMGGKRGRGREVGGFGHGYRQARDHSQRIDEFRRIECIEYILPVQSNWTGHNFATLPVHSRGMLE